MVLCPGIYHFGDFTLDVEAHALRKGGNRLLIQEQPLQILLALLEDPGTIVTRNTLRLRLWGTTTFVDFDQSLNSAVRRLRLVLDDNSRAPVYIETVPKIGFRFVGAVKRAVAKSAHPDTLASAAIGMQAALTAQA